MSCCRRSNSHHRPREKRDTYRSMITTPCKQSRQACEKKRRVSRLSVRSHKDRWTHSGVGVLARQPDRLPPSLALPNNRKRVRPKRERRVGRMRQVHRSSGVGVDVADEDAGRQSQFKYKARNLLHLLRTDPSPATKGRIEELTRPAHASDRQTYQT